MENSNKKTNKSNLPHYIVIGLLTCILGGFVLWIHHTSGKIIEKNEDPKAVLEKLDKEHLYVDVRSDMLRRLCQSYKDLDNCVFAKDGDAIVCNIPINGSSPKNVIERLFLPDKAEFIDELDLDDTNVIKLKTRVINKDTVVSCPVVMLFHLAQNHEKSGSDL